MRMPFVYLSCRNKYILIYSKSVKQVVLFILFLFFYTWGISAQTQILGGRFVNKSGKYISGVRITVIDLETDCLLWEGASDDMGFSVKLIDTS